jgi:Holliday junction resolvasome RuvABC endonuclease subunit
MSTLCLDLGTQTGFAILEDNQTIKSGSLSFRHDRYSGGGMRFLKFREWLVKINEKRTIDVVYFEEVRRHLGVDAAHVYGGFLATLTSWCEIMGIPYQGIPVGTIKKHITGKGNASKQDVIEAVCRRGRKPVDDNEADAVAILYYKTEPETATTIEKIVAVSTDT